MSVGSLGASVGSLGAAAAGSLGASVGSLEEAVVVEPSLPLLRQNSSPSDTSAMVSSLTRYLHIVAMLARFRQHYLSLVGSSRVRFKKKNIFHIFLKIDNVTVLDWGLDSKLKKKC